MATNRALVQDADSITQRELYVAAIADPVQDWYPAIAGQFRAAVLYSKQLVLTDAQIFDGALLLSLGPRGLAEMLGTTHRSPEVVIALRDESARVSLERLLKRQRFTGRSRLLSQVSTLDWSRREIDERREAWVRAIESGKFTISVWPTDFDFLVSLRDRLKDSRPQLESAVIDDLIEVTTRSTALTLIAKSGLSADDAETVTVWWDSSYMDTIALQHGATWIGSTSGGRSGQDTAVGGRRLRRSTGIPGVVISRVAEMSGPAFSVLRSDALSILNDYERHPTARNRFRLGVSILEATRTPKPILELVFTSLRILSWFGVVVFTFAPPDDSLRPLAIPLAIVGALLQAPVTDLVTVFRFVFRNQRAFIREPV